MKRTVLPGLLALALAAAIILCSMTAVAADGGICVAFGGNAVWQLGNGTLTDASAMEAGASHSLAVKSDGTVRAWGGNTYGQLGNNSNSNSSVPVQVKDFSDPTGNLTGVTEVAGGESHSLALKSDGTVRAWGRNHKGQLGDASNDDSNTAVRVEDPSDPTGYLTGVVALAAGANHSLVVKSDGRVWAWGCGEYYQLGELSGGVNRNTPVQAYMLSGAVAVAGGTNFSLALKNDGQAYKWGERCDYTVEYHPNNGFFWDGGWQPLTDVSAIAAGAGHGLALKDDGTVWAWGYNTYGQLGDNTTTSRITPAQVSGVAGAEYVAGGEGHSVVVLDDGTVRTFGLNDQGQLGDGTTANRSLPVTAYGISGATSAAGGGGHSLCITSENPVPTTTGLDPASRNAAQPGSFTLAVNGTNFNSGSIVRWNGADRATTCVNPTRLTVSVPEEDTAVGQEVSITVYNPPPGGGTSNEQTLAVNNPAPTTTSISPATAGAGQGDFWLTVNGTGFVNGPSVVRINGADRTTSFNSGTRLNALITESDIASIGTASITVYNPGPGGGTSNAQTLTINNPVPSIIQLQPGSTLVGGGDFTLRVGGEGFNTSSVVRWNGSDRATTLVSRYWLDAAIPASDIATIGTASITVYNPAPGGGTSGAATFTIANPAPTTTGLDPSTVLRDTGPRTLAVDGTNFVAGSTVRWNGADRPTTYVGPTRLTFDVTARDLEFAGTAGVTVFNVSPGGGTSNAQVLNVNNPAPTTTGLDPTSRMPGGAAFTLTVNGTGFISGSTVRWNSQERPTTYVSPTVLTADIPASDIAVARSVSITVFNRTPGGGTSNAQALTLDNPLPTAGGLDPATRMVGDGAFALTVNGTGFNSSSVVRLNGEDRATTLVSPTELTADIPAGDTQTAQVANVTVCNPGLGGGVSGGLPLTVNNLLPVTTGLDPVSRTAGAGAFTLTVEGANFVPGSTVRFNGEDRATTYVSPTRLRAAITAPGDTGNAGIHAVTVFNPGPGGGVSGSQAFTVNNAAPGTTGINPSQRDAGGGAFTLTVNGAGFSSSSVVRWNGEDRPTTFVNANRLTAAIPAGDTLAGGTAEVTVWNPAPGGGESDPPETFSINAALEDSPLSTWYVAEGSTAWGFNTYVTAMNPNPADLTARVTYMLDGGDSWNLDVRLPALSQTTVNPRDTLGDRDFSTRVASYDPTMPIAVDRTMYWTGGAGPGGSLSGAGSQAPGGGAGGEAHSSVGTNSPETTWYMPEGSTEWGFETWLCIQNPSPGEASCELTYMVKGGDPVTSVKKVPGNSRKTYPMLDDIGRKDASIRVVSDIPVICERSMYRNARSEGHESIGATTPALDYYLAEGTTAHGFSTYVCVQNPNGEACEVDITYMTTGGPKAHPGNPVKMPANSRETIRVNDFLPDSDFSTRVHGTKPVVAERSMYWDSGSGKACHDSIGTSRPAMAYYLPDGQTSEGRETWTCVQNPNAGPVKVTVTYLPAGGGSPVTFKDSLPANTRKTYNMADKGVVGRAAVLVRSDSPGKPVIVERAMYWDSRGAGTVTIGGSSDE